MRRPADHVTSLHVYRHICMYIMLYAYVLKGERFYKQNACEERNMAIKHLFKQKINKNKNKK